jgi:hypothetical protein
MNRLSDLLLFSPAALSVACTGEVVRPKDASGGSQTVGSTAATGGNNTGGRVTTLVGAPGGNLATGATPSNGGAGAGGTGAEAGAQAGLCLLTPQEPAQSNTVGIVQPYVTYRARAS